MKKQINPVAWVDEMIDEKKKRAKHAVVDNIDVKLFDVKYDDKTTEFDYALFKDKVGRKENYRVLRLFRIRSVSNLIRLEQNNEEEFKNILTNFAVPGVSFVSLYAFKPGEKLSVCYGILSEGNGNSKEKTLRNSKVYLDALETKFRVAYENIEIEPLNASDNWIFDSFHYNNLIVTHGIPKPDNGVGLRTGSNPYTPTMQAGKQVGEIILKGVTSKRQGSIAEGFPFLMYSVMEGITRDEIMNVLSEVNVLLGRIGSSKVLSLSESESMNFPMMFSLGYDASSGASQSDANGVTQATGTSHTVNLSEASGTSKGENTGFSDTQSDGMSTNTGTTRTQTQTEGGSYGVSQFVTANKTESSASADGITEGQGTTVSNSTGKTWGNSLTDSHTKTSGTADGESKTSSLSETRSNGVSTGHGQSAGASGGSGSGDSTGVNRVTIDYFMDTAERMYLHYRERVENSLRDGMLDFRMFVMAPDEETKTVLEELIKQSYVDIKTPNPIRIEQLTKEEERKLVKYARAMGKPKAINPNVDVPDRYRYSTYITPSEASAFNLPQVNLPGYNSSVDPIPQSINYIGPMEQGAVLGFQINPSLNMRSNYEYRLTWEEVKQHLLIVGQTGKGKTVFTNQYISEIHNKFDANILIFDWMKNYRSLPGYLKNKSKFRFNSFDQGYFPMKVNLIRTPTGVPEYLWNAALSEILCYSMGLGDRSFRIIKKVIRKIKEAKGENATMKDLVLGLKTEENEREKEYKSVGDRMPFNEKQSFASIRERVEEWVDENHPVYDAMCRGPFIKIEELIEGEFVHLIECGHLPGEVKPFVINGLTAAIFYYSKFGKKHHKPMFTFFEEAHIVLTSLTGEEPLKVNETIFETINREARNCNMFIGYIVQSPETLPELIIDNSPLRVVFQIGNAKGKELIVSAGGRDPNRLDVDIVKFISRLPDGVCIIRNSKYKRMQGGEFAAVLIDMRYNQELDDAAFKRLIDRYSSANAVT